MNEFRLFALGEEFDVDRFVKRSSLEFSRIWHRGDRKPSCGTSRYPTSGCVIDLGDGLTLPLPQQEHVARDFLVAQVAQLRDLRAFPGVTHVTLGLHYPVKVRENLAGLCMGPRLSLMRAALDAQVALNYYVALIHPDVTDRWDDEE